MKLIVEPIWSWPICLLVAIGLLAMVLVLYPPRVRHLPTFSRRSLMGLRLFAVLALIFAMFRPAIHVTETDNKSAVLFVLADASRSMNTQDGPGGITRRAAILKTISDCRDQIAELKEEFEIRIFDFDKELRAVERMAPEAAGDQTAMGVVMEALLRETQSQRMIGVVMLGDGAQRAVAPFDADPRSMARRLGELQIPVHTVGFGASGLSESSFDVIVEDLLADLVVFEKKTVPIEAKIRVIGAAGREFTVRLMVEDLASAKPGESGEMKVPRGSKNAQPVKSLKTARNAAVLPVELTFIPEIPGEYKVWLEVVPLDGELITSNNRVETLITVQKGGIEVAYFDKFRPELRAVRLLRSSENIQLDTKIVRSGRFKRLTDIEAEWFERGRYDVYLIGDVPAQVFGRKHLAELKKRIDEGAGLMMMGGFRSFGPGGYAETTLAEVLPVAMNPTDLQTGDEISPDLHHLSDLAMIPTEAGLQHFVMRLDPISRQKNKETWLKLPPLSGANRLREKSDFVEVLAKSEDGIPLLFAQPAGKARVMAFGGDTTYLWMQHGFHEQTLRFWRQTIHWLARKEMEGDQAVWVRVDPRTYNPGAPAHMTFGARDEDGQPIEDMQFGVEVTTSNGDKHTITPQKGAGHSLGTFLNTQEAGDYWVSVTATKDGQQWGNVVTARFLVHARDLEMDNPAADLGLLEQIAALSGGTVIPPEQLVSYFNRLLKEGPGNLEATTVSRTTLWDNWYFLGLFVLVMSAEWLLRKMRGLV